MSYRDQSGGYPPPREPETHSYPPPPGEEDDRARAYHQRAPSSSNPVTLPPISPYENQYAQSPNGYPDARGYQQDPYRGQPAPAYRDDRGYPPQDYGRPPQQHMSFSQSAPRQRTAIACRYCRRRKIRCSGFDQNPEGRCSNCQRFQQECIFTPVSSQAQAFVPAHAVYPQMRNMTVGPDGRAHPVYPPQGTQLFGAHGQPLGPMPPQPVQRGPTAGGYEYPAPSPTSSYSSYGDDRTPTSAQEQSRKRPQQDPHTSILPPPMPAQQYPRNEAPGYRRPAIEDDVRLPPVTPTGGQSAANYSPGSSTSSTSNLQPPHQSTGPSTSRTPPPRSSPAEGRADPMSIGNIMESRPPGSDIDRGMLGRLNRPSEAR